MVSHCSWKRSAEESLKQLHDFTVREQRTTSDSGVLPVASESKFASSVDFVRSRDDLFGFMSFAFAETKSHLATLISFLRHDAVFP